MTRKKVSIDGKKYYIHPFFTKYAASKEGEILNVKTGRILKKNLTDQGYYQFKVTDKKLIKPKNYYIHRFEWECVKGVIPEGFVIDHIDSVKTNNKIENLQLLTLAEMLEKEIVNLYYHLILKITNKKIMKVLLLLHSN